MELSIKERLLLLVILPKESDITTLKVLKELRLALAFTEDELAKWEIKQDGSAFAWKNDLTPEEQIASVKVGPKAFEIVKESLAKLNAEKKLTEDFIDLWDKFNDEGNTVHAVK